MALQLMSIRSGRQRCGLPYAGANEDGEACYDGSAGGSHCFPLSVSASSGAGGRATTPAPTARCRWSSARIGMLCPCDQEPPPDSAAAGAQLPHDRQPPRHEWRVAAPLLDGNTCEPRDLDVRRPARRFARTGAGPDSSRDGRAITGSGAAQARGARSDGTCRIIRVSSPAPGAFAGTAALPKSLDSLVRPRPPRARRRVCRLKLKAMEERRLDDPGTTLLKTAGECRASHAALCGAFRM